MTGTVNPYQAPAAALADAAESPQPVRVFSVSGRIGRVRYFAYGFGFCVLLGFVGGLLGVLFGIVGAVATLLAWIALAVIGFMLTIQRCHDFNASGWLSLLVLVPLANLIFLVVPGTDGPNRFGAPTPPNTMGVLIAAWLMPALTAIGIIFVVTS